jgi:spore germination protein GerM
MKKLTLLLSIIFLCSLFFSNISIAASGTKTIPCKIYFPFSYYDGFYSVAETQNVQVTNGAIAKAVINKMLQYPNRKRIGIGYGTKLKSLNLKNGLLKVDFSKEFLNCPWGSSGEGMMLMSIVNTLTEFSTVNKVQFLVEGNPDVCLGHVCVDEPVSRKESSIADVITKKVTLYNISNHPTQYYLEPVQKNIKVVNKAVAKAVIYELLYNNSLNNSIPNGTSLRSLSLKNGTLTIDFSKEFRYTNLGSGYEHLMLYTIVNSVTEFSTIKRVQFLIEGKKEDLGHISLDQTFTRDTSIIR